MQIDSWLTGSGDFCYGMSGVADWAAMTCKLRARTIPSNGQWLVDQGVLVGVGTTALGTNNILVGMNGLTAAVETLYDIHNTNGSLILGVNGKMYLHQNDTFKSVLINNVSLAAGTYSYATLNSIYPANFPSSWTLQNGSSINTASGSITVLANPAPIIVTQPQPMSRYLGQAAATASVRRWQWAPRHLATDGSRMAPLL